MKNICNRARLVFTLMTMSYDARPTLLLLLVQTKVIITVLGMLSWMESSSWGHVLQEVIWFTTYPTATFYTSVHFHVVLILLKKWFFRVGVWYWYYPLPQKKLNYPCLNSTWPVNSYHKNRKKGASTYVINWQVNIPVVGVEKVKNQKPMQAATCVINGCIK